jgi:hypothetical protein
MAKRRPPIDFSDGPSLEEMGIKINAPEDNIIDTGNTDGSTTVSDSTASTIIQTDVTSSNNSPYYDTTPPGQNINPSSGNINLCTTHDGTTGDSNTSYEPTPIDITNSSITTTYTSHDKEDDELCITDTGTSSLGMSSLNTPPLNSIDSSTIRKHITQYGNASFDNTLSTTTESDTAQLRNTPINNTEGLAPGESNSMSNTHAYIAPIATTLISNTPSGITHSKPKGNALYLSVIRDYLERALGGEDRVEIKIKDMEKNLGISKNALYRHLRTLRETEFFITKLRFSTEIKRRARQNNPGNPES